MDGDTHGKRVLDLAARIDKDRNQVYQWLLEPGTPGARNLGHTNARRIEQVFGLPPGWLDTEQDSENFSIIQGHSPPSHLLSLDRDNLHAALTLLLLDENPIVGGGPYRPREQADRLAELYEWVCRDGGRLSDESNARFLEQVEARRQAKVGRSNVQDRGGAGLRVGEQRGRIASGGD